MSDLEIPRYQQDNGVEGVGYNKGVDDCRPVITQLKQKNAELMARVERLEEAIRQEHLEIEAYAHLSSATVKEITDSLVYKNLDDMLEEKPQQRLAEIEAAAVEEYGSYKAKALLNGDDVMSPAEYAQQLLDKSKEQDG